MQNTKAVDIDLAKDLRRGLRHGEFSVVLQPKISLINHQVVGAEILSRWHHPHYGRVTPKVWVVMAESQGLMRELTEWLVRQALQCMFLQVPLSINVCPSVFDRDLVDFIAKEFHKESIAPSLLELEITESVKPRNIRDLADAVRYAQTHGFQVALDDFGAGFCTLSSLLELPVNVVKIDQSIVQKVTQDNSSALICHTLISLAQETGAKVVCEGVETEEQYHRILHMGADMVQGFLFGRPMPIDTVAFYLKGGSSNPRNLRECN